MKLPHFFRTFCATFALLLAASQTFGCATHVDDISAENDRLYDGFYINGDGCLYDPAVFSIDNLSPLYPAGQMNNGLAAILINGANNRANAQYAQMKLLAKYYDRPIIGIHNGATSSAIGELRETIPGNDKSVSTLVSAMQRRVGRDQQTLRVVALSQGAIYLSRALDRIKSALKYNEEQLALIEVETFGGAMSWYVNGPQYVHYANTQDPIPSYLGVNSPMRRLGNHSVVNVFSVADSSCAFFMEPATKISQVHSLCAYIKWRRPFEEVRKLATSKKSIWVKL